MSTTTEKKVPMRTEEQNQSIMYEALIDKMPLKVQGYARAILPFFIMGGKFINTLGPYFVQAYDLILKGQAALAPYHPELIWGMVWGLTMMFFGGYFVLVIASYEAFRLSGWESFKVAFTKIKANYDAFQVGNTEDNEKDEDNDGIADVLQIDKAHLITRKIQVFMLNTNPEEISNALGSLYTGLLGVIAALKIQFARTIALGATIGECLETPAKKYLTPVLFKMTPREYHNWVTVGVTYITRSIGVSIAWFLQRVISSVHAAIKGGTMFTAAFAEFTGKYGYTTLSEGYFDEIFAVIAAFVGLYLQLSNMFVLPWYLNLLLLPLVIPDALTYFLI